MIAFMQSFYATSDTESSHDAYVDSFTDDATLIMGPKTAKGSSGTFTRFPFSEYHVQCTGRKYRCSPHRYLLQC